MSNQRIRPGHPSFAGFGSLGATNPLVSTGLKTAGSYAGGAAAGAMAGAAAGSVVPVIGTIIGGVVGMLAGGLFGHADHAKINADVNARQNLFGQYASMAGTVPGRQIGLASMREIWKGAAHEGHFPKWQGQEQRIDYAIDGCNKCDPNTFNVLWPKASAAGVRDAKTFIDNYFIPANQQAGDHWAVPQDAIGFQILYDTADAYLSQKAPSSVAFIARAPSPTPAPIQPNPVTTMPTPTPVGQPMPVAGQGVTPQSLMAAGYLVAGRDPSTGYTVYQQPGGPLVVLLNGQLLPYRQAPQGANSTQLPVTIPPPVLQTVLPSGQVVPSSALDPSTQSLINQLISQGATQQQAFAAAMQNLQAQGIQPTAAVQQQVASALPQPATAGLSGNWTMYVVAGLAVLSVIFATARPMGATARAAR